MLAIAETKQLIDKSDEFIPISVQRSEISGLTKGYIAEIRLKHPPTMRNQEKMLTVRGLYIEGFSVMTHLKSMMLVLLKNDWYWP